jgi:hypothetical protein
MIVVVLMPEFVYAGTFLHPAAWQITAKAFHDADGTTSRAIGLRSLDCSGGSALEVAASRLEPDHPTNPCHLHEYRLGHNPKSLVR